MSTYLSLIEGGGGGGRLFEAGRSLTFSAFRMGACSRWALIRGWALIRINSVRRNQVLFSIYHEVLPQLRMSLLFTHDNEAMLFVTVLTEECAGHLK